MFILRSIAEEPMKEKINNVVWQTAEYSLWQRVSNDILQPLQMKVRSGMARKIWLNLTCIVKDHTYDLLVLKKNRR